MKVRKISIILGAAVVVLFPCLHLGAAPSLVSLKQGSESGRYWVVFVFDEEARWLSISKPGAGQLSVYFSGDAGDKDGQDLTVEEGQCSVSVEQVNRKTSVFKAVLNYNETLPVSVVGRSNTVVIGFNDSRLLTQTSKTSTNSDRYAELISVSEQSQASGMETRFQFNADFKWTGYFETSNRQITLLFSGVSNMSPVDNYIMNNPVVQNVNIRTDMAVPDILKIDMDMALNSGFTLLQKGTDLVVSGKAANGEIASRDIAFNEPLTTPVESASAVIEQPAGTYNQSMIPSEASGAAPVQDYGARSDNALLNSGQEPAAEETGIPWDRIVSFEFASTPIQDALRLIAISNSLNMVIGENVIGTVTMNLENVTLRQAMERILHTHDMEYLVEDNIITIKPVRIAFTGGMQTKVYRLKYADAVNVSNVIKRIASNDSLVEVFSTEFLNFETAGTNRKSAAGVAVQGIRRSSMIVVTDRPEKIREIDQLVSELDRAPIQIMIESKLVEIAPNYTENLGIDWDETLSMYLENTQNESGTGKDRMLQISEGSNNSWVAGTWKLGRLTANQYSAVLDVLKEKTDATLRLNPRILAMNDEESSISVGTTVPIPEIQQGTSSSSERITFSYKEVNVQLNVTPHVGHNEEIVMYVNPVIEEISDWVEYGSQRAPITSKRAVNSIVSVRNGETIVIGGLIKNQEIKVVKKVWLLGSIPLIGRFFQHLSTDETQTDMMIFITPTIIKANG